ncbi:hypothetical protein FB645_000845 [Coemansia sp. IMI 203386]|nr:hypothetical protein FB645_000845 [Coemansia sp. IMI 203386]
MAIDSTYSIDEGQNTLLSITVHADENSAVDKMSSADHPWHSLVESRAGLRNDVSGERTAAKNNTGSGNTMREASGSAVATDECFDDITSQGLLEGLEELYEQSETVPLSLDSSIDTKPSMSNDESRAADEDTDSSKQQELPDMDPDEAASIVNKHGGFLGARSVPMPKDKGVKLVQVQSQVKRPRLSEGLNKSEPNESTATGQASNELEDMSDSEAMEILGKHGGFTTSASGARNKQPVPKPSASKTTADGSSTAAEKDEGLPDMDDDEALRLLDQHGGFSKSGLATQLRRSAKIDTSVHSRSTLHTRTPSPSPAPGPKPVTGASPGEGQAIAYSKSGMTTPRGSALNAATAASPKTPSLFPSRQDVRSARRALIGDSGRPAGPSFNTPAVRSARKLSYGTPGSSHKPLKSAHSPSAMLASSPATSSQQQSPLSFKLPGLKRQAPRSTFTPPAKRSSIVQQFRSPAKSADYSPVPLPVRSKPPPKLPPVTVRNSAAKITPESATGRHPSASLRKIKSDRLSLQSVVDQIATTEQEAAAKGVPQEAIAITAKTAGEFRFAVGTGHWGWPEARQTLVVRGCVPGAIPDAWVRNHFRWCVWNAASYARRLPAMWSSFWSVEAVVDRLWRRYEREHLHSQRSALKRILEADSAAQQPMVLVVSELDCTGDKLRVEVTDGWYAVAASVDSVLERAVRGGRLRVGDKITCIGARLNGVNEGVDPLSAEALGATLVLNANGVRRARWDARLGFQTRTRFFMSLSAIHQQGGSIGPAVDVVVMRSYPMLFRETLADGRHIVRCEKEEMRERDAFEQRRSAHLQDLAEKANKQAVQHGAPGAASEGSRLYDMLMNENTDPAESQLRLTESQRNALECYAAERRAATADTLLQAVEKVQPARQVRSFFRILVCDYPVLGASQPEGSSAPRLATVTFWAPRGLEPKDFVEGQRVLLTGLTVSPQRAATAATTPDGPQQQQQSKAPLRLNFNASGSSWQPMPAEQPAIDLSEYRERGVLHIDELWQVDSYQEVDLVGTVQSCRHPGSDQEGGMVLTQSVLRLESSDEHGHQYCASISFDAATFGLAKPDVGSPVTVRNCICLKPSNAETSTFLLRADDTTEFQFGVPRTMAT